MKKWNKDTAMIAYQIFKHLLNEQLNLFDYKSTWNEDGWVSSSILAWETTARFLFPEQMEFERNMLFKETKFLDFVSSRTNEGLRGLKRGRFNDWLQFLINDEKLADNIIASINWKNDYEKIAYC